MIKAATMVLAGLLVALPAGAEERNPALATGDLLIDICKTTEELCYMYLSGFVEGLRMGEGMATQETICEGPRDPGWLKVLRHQFIARAPVMIRRIEQLDAPRVGMISWLVLLELWGSCPPTEPLPKD